MFVVRFGKVYSFCILLLVFGGLGRAEPAIQAPSIDEIVRRAVARAKEAETLSAQTGYTYTKVSVTDQIDGRGHIKDHKEKVYQVALQGGAMRVKLLGVNGHAPTEADLKKQAENQMSIRQVLGEPKSTTDAARDNFLTPELAARFDFRLLGQTDVNGRPTYKIGFQPKNPEPVVHRLVDRLLNRISGTIWIDAQEYEVAQAQLRLQSEVDLLGGVAGCLKKLAYTVVRTRVADGIWLNQTSTGDFEGRKLLDPMRVKMKTQTSNFKPLAMNATERPVG